ncbi:MAG: hypothetical protein UY92_C0013G0038 [Candidatus Magasanikbacteria bacterium GW2011_GWA2_56_11]|uniref:Uncharacterized protein n=1 Tax=Candidatus Magasanikbacteria bacterium GW2011_GWA2_56_11 TaxID=1619044 RepID=A0A0G2B8Q5_9BACT|nr:MAG: hypothetical protein UY92_C0013G0038 [Candidatus Magasanikbacteria bacterium GW2011_GWA2_56_11]
MQMSVVQGSASSQSVATAQALQPAMSVFWQLPARQVSAVQASASSQSAATAHSGAQAGLAAASAAAVRAAREARAVGGAGGQADGVERAVGVVAVDQQIPVVVEPLRAEELDREAHAVGVLVAARGAPAGLAGQEVGRRVLRVHGAAGVVEGRHALARDALHVLRALRGRRAGHVVAPREAKSPALDIGRAAPDVKDRSRHARAVLAGVARRARVRVIARHRVGRELAPRGRVARVVGALVRVVAGDGRAVAGTTDTHVARRAGVRVVAGRVGRRGHGRADVVDARRDHARVAARLALRVDLTLVTRGLDRPADDRPLLVEGLPRDASSAAHAHRRPQRQQTVLHGNLHASCGPKGPGNTDGACRRQIGPPMGTATPCPLANAAGRRTVEAKAVYGCSRFHSSAAEVKYLSCNL